MADGTAKLRQNGRTQEFEIKELPEEFVRWQLDYKKRIYATIEKDEYVAFNSGHLPVVGAWDANSMYPNLANKGVGLTPKVEHLEHYIDLVEGAVAKIEDLPPHAVDDTRQPRISTAREFYSHPEHPRNRFSWAICRLFDCEPFHMVQTIFPYSYTFWVYDWIEKTPKGRYKR